MLNAFFKGLPEIQNIIFSGQYGNPLRGNLLHSIIQTCQRTGYATRRVCVLAKIHCFQNCIRIAICYQKTPQTCFKRMQNITRCIYLFFTECVNLPIENLLKKIYLRLIKRISLNQIVDFFYRLLISSVLLLPCKKLYDELRINETRKNGSEMSMSYP